MRDISPDFVSDDRGLAVLTTDDPDGGSLYLADFRDTHALILSETGNFLGLTESRGIRLGKHPLRMMDGVWYATEDAGAAARMPDLEVSPGMLELALIR